ncbi:hypothetical protein LZ31DRAFT_80207 [Colletotrichum somersetense]|nr:hypothetical protein LZ31DRAFT_80207 [Colletotrichum somersetense]
MGIPPDLLCLHGILCGVECEISASSRPFPRRELPGSWMPLSTLKHHSRNLRSRRNADAAMNVLDTYLSSARDGKNRIVMPSLHFHFS